MYLISLSNTYISEKKKQIDNKYLYRCFFTVQLIDPQVNFLDTNKHSSLLLVASKASIEGRRQSMVYLSMYLSNSYTNLSNCI
jgi:hypothetical protein